MPIPNRRSAPPSFRGRTTEFRQAPRRTVYPSGRRKAARARLRRQGRISKRSVDHCWQDARLPRAMRR
ncbi:MAG: hypothetical protein E5W70_10725 [Mesorhizobium sp.]|nr:MAG: hypothetical protein E5W70_10725 [Mesorhizobium sp.]